MPDALLERLDEIAQAAAKVVLEVYAGDFTARAKDDASPVTEADLRADAVIRQALSESFPEVPIVSEESSNRVPPGVRRFFLVDPLDGTKEFLKRNGEFTVNIALVVDGQPQAAVVGVPALATRYLAAIGQGAVRRVGPGPDVPLRVTRADRQVPLRIVGSRSHGSPEFDAWLARLPMPFTHQAAGSSLKFCRLAEGAADVYPRLGPTCQWDTAAGQCVLEAAGGVVLTAGGLPLRYGVDRPIKNPAFLALGDPGLRDRLPDIA